MFNDLKAAHQGIVRGRLVGQERKNIVAIDFSTGRLGLLQHGGVAVHAYGWVAEARQKLHPFTTPTT